MPESKLDCPDWISHQYYLEQCQAPTCGSVADTDKAMEDTFSSNCVSLFTICNLIDFIVRR